MLVNGGGRVFQTGVKSPCGFAAETRSKCDWRICVEEADIASETAKPFANFLDSLVFWRNTPTFIKSSEAMSVDFSHATRGLQNLLNDFVERSPSIIAALIVFFIFYFAAKAIRTLIRRLTEKRERHRNLAFVLGRLAQVGIVALGLLIALVIALPTFKPGQLVQFLGIGSVAIGFAFRDILQNFLAGILLLLNEPFRIGDQIKFGDFEGIVEDIQIRATMMRTYDARKIVIPNTNLFTNPVTVNTAFENRRLEYDFGIGYGDDIARAKQLVLEALKTVKQVLSDPAPDVLVYALNASWVTLRVRWWIKPPRRFEALTSQDKVLEAIKKKLVENGIDLPFEVRTVLFHDQTDENDGDRLRQREGWPAGKGEVPKPRSVEGALQIIAGLMAETQKGAAAQESPADRKKTP